MCIWTSRTLCVMASPAEIQVIPSLQSGHCDHLASFRDWKSTTSRSSTTSSYGQPWSTKFYSPQSLHTWWPRGTLPPRCISIVFHYTKMAAPCQRQRPVNDKPPLIPTRAPCHRPNDKSAVSDLRQCTSAYMLYTTLSDSSDTDSVVKHSETETRNRFNLSTDVKCQSSVSIKLVQAAIHRLFWLATTDYLPAQVVLGVRLAARPAGENPTSRK